MTRWMLKFACAVAALAFVAGSALVPALGGAAFAAEARMTVEDVRVEPGDPTTVFVTLSDVAEGSAVAAFNLSDPERIVVDVPDARAEPTLAGRVVSGGLVSRVEVETIEDEHGVITRIQLHVARSVRHQVKTEGRVVRVTLGGRTQTDPLAAALGAGSGGTASTTPAELSSSTASSSGGRPVGAGGRLSGPDAIPSGPSLSSIDFENLDRVSRIVIGTNQPIDYTASQPEPYLVVVDFPRTFVPQSLKRVLDASEFISPVRRVRAYPTSAGARVEIALRAVTDYKVTVSEKGLIWVDVAIPADMLQDRQMAAQGFAVVSPEESGGGIHNKYQQETFITSQGRSVDPNALWGSGGGSSDPSSLLGMAAGFLYDSTSTGQLPFSGKRISLDFVNADIHSIFRLISSVSRLNIVAGDDVSGKVTVRMEDVPWDQALAAVLQAKGLGSQRFGNIIRVAPIETIKTEQQAALEAKRAKLELTDLDLLVLPLNYATVSEMEAQIRSLLTLNRGSLQVDARGNQLIIKDTAENLAQIRELVRHLDKQTPQVLIEARVVEVSTSYLKTMGVQWGGELDATTNTGSTTGLYFPSGVGMSGGIDPLTKSAILYSPDASNLLVDLGPSASAGALSMQLGSIGGVLTLDARLAAMESDGWGRVVSTPKVTTLDNKEATISQGAKIPFLSVSAQGTQVNFITAALELKVTPHITSDNKVFLKIAVSNNRADFSVLVQGQPAIQIKEAATELLVADGDTTVLGGVFATEEAFAQSRLPGLAKIPILGYLFKNSTETLTRNELLVFITPHIVTRAMADQG